MFLLIVAIILLLVAVGLLIIGKVPTAPEARDYRDNVTRPAQYVNLRPFALIPILLALIAFVLSISTVVEAKNVGVVTGFGKPVDSLTPGFSTKKPWEKVTDIDGTIQTRQYHGDNALDVRIGDGSRSSVSLTLRWQIKPDEADVIYADYRSDNPTEEVGDKLVSPQLKAALQKTLGDYNPIASLKVVKASEAGQPVSFAPDFDQIGDELLSDLQGRSELVEILSVDVTYVTISDNTQKALDDFNAAVGQTVVAQQNKETSTAQAEANKELEGAISPEINQARCIDALNTAIEKGYALPAGFNCLGGGGSLVIPAK